ncbi:MAG: LysE family translocator [Halofilum sp. (in: g-proteobacteria)]|nr:LysE family translocator [Halofilum sp. (in: g-proteobacteria)]
MIAETYMAYLATLAVFFAAPPGPSQSLMIANSLRHGVRRSTATVCGDLSANALQMTAAAFGLTLVIASSYWLLTVVKWAGVAYLLWIGWRRFTARGAGAPGGDGPRYSAGRLWRQGFVTSASNPRAIFFFAALFPQFIDLADPIAPQLLVLGATYLAVDGTLLMAWGLLAEQLAGRVQAIGNRLNRVSGGLMMLAAALLASRDVDPAAAGPR